MGMKNSGPQAIDLDAMADTIVGDEELQAKAMAAFAAAEARKKAKAKAAAAAGKPNA
jgi:hypothetical protein